MYSATSSPKRSTVPPAVPPKPTIAPKPRRLMSSPATVGQPTKVSSPPTQIRGTRASNLRQVSSATTPKVSPPSPKFHHPRSTGSSAGSTSSGSSTRCQCYKLLRHQRRGTIGQAVNPRKAFLAQSTVEMNTSTRVGLVLKSRLQGLAGTNTLAYLASK